MDQTRKKILQLIDARRPLPPPAQRAELRKAARLRLQDIADLIGVSAPAVWNWERGKYEPKADHYETYRDLLETLAKQAG